MGMIVPMVLHERPSLTLIVPRSATVVKHLGELAYVDQIVGKRPRYSVFGNSPTSGMA